MAFSRPLGKELLKKMMLKVYCEFRQRGRFAGYGDSQSPESVLRGQLPDYFGITKLDDAEYRAGYRGAYELERDGFLVQDAFQTHAPFKMLSEIGWKIASESLDSMKLTTIGIDQFVNRDDLRSLIRDDFNSFEYETAVFKAFKLLEESVRKKANEPPSSLGVTLMSAAFSPANGKLKHPGAAVSQEQDGLHQMMRGAIAWFKNPSSHRTVPRDDPFQAAHALAFANLLLDLLDECN